ncbi:hypothetical protein [Herbaspirillum huttiense]|uniref:hypothetical protein n=1 Tax=Herbaspirillum huttiense TaxID=863372 RepID=UPI0039AFFB2D
MTRCLSMLLTRLAVPHQVLIGQLTVRGAVTPLHWWIQLADGRLIDLRARMWLGDSQEVPHGLFSPTPHALYRATKTQVVEIDPWLFQVLSGRSMEDIFLSSNF